MEIEAQKPTPPAPRAKGAALPAIGPRSNDSFVAQIVTVKVYMLPRFTRKVW